jgi:extradiol dioxygenase family protein
VVRAEAQLVDSQGAPIKRFGFVWPVDRLEQLRQIIEVAGDPWMVRAAG